MKTKELNLLDVNRSDVKYDVFENFITLTEHPSSEYVNIITRLTTPNDLYKLMQVCDTLTRVGTRYGLVITYLMGQEYSKLDNLLDPFALRVVANVINALKALQVYVVETDTVRPSLEIDNCTALCPIETYFIKGDIDLKENQIVLPNSGAIEKYGDWFKSHSPHPVIVAENNEIINKDELNDLPKIVFDNTLTSMRGFSTIATQITTKKTLMVTHAVEGVAEMSVVYDEVRITNSYQEFTDLPENVKLLNISELF